MELGEDKGIGVKWDEGGGVESGENRIGVGKKKRSHLRGKRPIKR